MDGREEPRECPRKGGSITYNPAHEPVLPSAGGDFSRRPSNPSVRRSIRGEFLDKIVETTNDLANEAASGGFGWNLWTQSDSGSQTLVLSTCLIVKMEGSRHKRPRLLQWKPFGKLRDAIRTHDSAN